MNLKDAIILVTGAGRGIGRAIALALAKEGAHVLLNARTVTDLEQLQKEIGAAGGRADVYQADVTDDDQVSWMFQSIEKRHSRLDALVNNAGIGHFGPVRSLPMK